MFYSASGAIQHFDWLFMTWRSWWATKTSRSDLRPTQPSIGHMTPFSPSQASSGHFKFSKNKGKSKIFIIILSLLLELHLQIVLCIVLCHWSMWAHETLIPLGETPAPWDGVWCAHKNHWLGNGSLNSDICVSGSQPWFVFIFWLLLLILSTDLHRNNINYCPHSEGCIMVKKITVFEHELRG